MTVEYIKDLKELHKIVKNDKIPICIIDKFIKVYSVSDDFYFQKIDETEKKEKHVIGAVQDNIKVPIPKFTEIKIPSFFKRVNYFKPYKRCFVYNSNFFEPITYHVSKDDVDFVNTFNNNHKFLKITIPNIEHVIVAIENLIKDGVPDKFSAEHVMLYLDPDKRPPYPVIHAIFEYWKTKSNLIGSVVKLNEYPPEYYELRKDFIKEAQLKMRQKKSYKDDAAYMKKLYSELISVQNKRVQALEALEQQKRQYKENIIFLRKIVREVLKKNDPKYVLVLQPELDNDPLRNEEFKDYGSMSLLPDTPNVPSFLKWCSEQVV